MNIILIAIIPTILLLVLGNILRRYDFLALSFWSASDKLTYFILFPALLISKVAVVDLSTIDFMQLFIFIVIYFSAISLLAYVLYRLTRATKQQFSSIYQGVLRFNSYVYFAIIAAVWGGQTMATAALIAGVCIPVVNVCCVAAFSLASGKFSWQSSLFSMLKNPLILASLLGFVINLFPVLLPRALFDTLVILSKAALPLALLSVGAAVRVKKLFITQGTFSYFTLWGATVARLVIAPLIALSVAHLLGIGHEITQVLVMFAAVPTATSSFILAKQLGGDAELMATMISLQTVLSMLSLLFWLDYLVS